MKIKFLIVIVALSSQISFAQSVFPIDGGNVGIGTTLPTNNLTIIKPLDQNFAHIYFGVPMAVSGQPSASLCFGGSGIQNSGFTWVPNNIDEGKLHLSFGGYDNGIKNPIKMTFQSNGNVGIGTTNPKQKFVVSNDGAEGFELYLDQLTSIVGLQSYNRVLNSYSKMQLDASQFSFMYGNVGIGTQNPDAKLAVNGIIHSKEIKVDMIGWPDYVFKKEYNLPTLEEVEKHIAEKGHLENIPSEKEVLENGIKLGEMNAKLLQKIEELTLYMIEMKKENTEMKKQTVSVKNENDLMRKNQMDLEKRILKIENK